MPATRVVVGVANWLVKLGLALGVDGTADIALAMVNLNRVLSLLCVSVCQYARDFDFVSRD